MTMCPSSAARARAPRSSAPVDDDPAADPGAERQQRACAAPRGGAEAVLGEHRAVRVVVDEDRQARAARPSGRGTARRRSAGARCMTAMPRSLVDERRDPEADRVDRAPTRARPRRAPRRRPRRRSSTAPGPAPRPAGGAVVDVQGRSRPRRRGSFVPPRSTPMTQPVATIGHHTSPDADARGRGEPPEYTRYRARPRLFGGGRRDPDARDPPARRRAAAPHRAAPGARRGAERSAGLAAGAIAGWIALSVVAFVVSARSTRRSSGANELLAAAATRRSPDDGPRARHRRATRGHRASRARRPAAPAARTRSCSCASAAATTPALDPPRHGRRHPRPRPRTRSTPRTRSAARR